MPQPELLGGDVSLHRRLIQRRDDVPAESVERRFHSLAKRMVLGERVGEIIDGQAELLAGGERAGPFRQQFEKETLLERCQ